MAFQCHRNTYPFYLVAHTWFIDSGMAVRPISVDDFGVAVCTLGGESSLTLHNATFLIASAGSRAIFDN